MIETLNIKKRILDLAIKGKLSEQNPNDNSVEAFLASAKEEKKIIVRKYKGKKRPTIIPVSEVPFYIPSSWKWIRLGDVVEIFGRIGFRGYTKQDIVSPGQGAISFSPSNINDGKLFFDNLTYISWEKYEESPEIAVNEGDIILCKTASIGKTAKVVGLKEKATINPQLVVFKDVQCDVDYLLYFLLSSCAQKQMVDFTVGTSIPTFTQEKLANMLFVFPPIEEQSRIAKKISKIFALLDEIDINQEQVLELEKKIKTKVLEAAIRGKLVEQKVTGETVNELLADIENQKNHLVNNKVVKPFKKTIPIRQDEIPFDIPSNWKWVRLSDVCTKIVDGDHNPPAGVDKKTDYLMVSAINVNDDKICELTRVRYLDEDTFKIEDERTKLKKGDILLTIVGTMGRSCIYDGKLNLTFQRSVSVITTLIDNEYLKRVFDSPYIQKFMEFNSTGTAQKGFYLNQVSSLLIPVPPLEEQKRIVSRINDIFSKL